MLFDFYVYVFIGKFVCFNYFLLEVVQGVYLYQRLFGFMCQFDLYFFQIEVR